MVTASIVMLVCLHLIRLIMIQIDWNMKQRHQIHHQLHQGKKPPDAPKHQQHLLFLKNTAPKAECPTREQQLKNPVGKILEGNKKIVGYEVVGKECLMVTENLRYS